jgi:hypothetical protein
LKLKLFVCAFVFVLGCTGRSVAAEVRKIAVIVGSNSAPPGRVTLRYAHEDARRVAEVLLAVGGFAARDVQVLLDPEPDGVLAALDAELASSAKRSEQTLLFFYYSGHADERAIFPHGKALSFTALKTRLDDTRVKLRLGVLDSCRGGGWTGSKGLKKVEPFQIDTALQLAEEGSVLIASSSGQESAHETETLQGSFFTHYWNAGLRGAADRGGDGVVTLSEAFEYARTLTIRDTALLGHEPQHPSFQMKLTGRRDFPLSTLVSQKTTLLYEQATGPTEIVRLNDGLVVVETQPGARRVRLGLPAGSYLVRRRTSDGVYARIVSLSAGAPATLGEGELARSNVAPGRSKGSDALEPGSWLGQWLFASAAAGVRHAPLIDPGLRAGAADGQGIVLLRASLRIAPRFWWQSPLALVFDAERPAPFAWFAWAGVPVLSATRRADASYAFSSFVGAGVDARFRHGERHTFNAALSELGGFEWGQSWPETFGTQVTLGISETIPDAVTFSLGAALGANFVANGRFSSASADSVERNLVLGLGSVQRVGLRPLPLVHVPVGAGFGVDVHAVVAYLPALQGWVETYLGGISYVN